MHLNFRHQSSPQKGVKGKKNSMYFHCMHRKTDKKKPRQGY